MNAPITMLENELVCHPDNFTLQDSGVYKDEGEEGHNIPSSINPPTILEDARLMMPSPSVEDVGSLSEVQAVPALILDHDNPYDNLNHYDDNDDDDDDPDDIVVKTSQFYGIDLVTLLIFKILILYFFIFQSIPPPLPSRRDYRVEGGVKIYFRNN